LTSPLSGDEAERPVLICLLGRFRLLARGRALSVRPGGKTEAVLGYLALHSSASVPRDLLLETVWPDRDRSLAGQSLNTVLHGLHRLLGCCIGGASPVQHDGGQYRLNTEAGVEIDVTWFDDLVAAGEQFAAAGDWECASTLFERAIHLYQGPLSGVSSIEGLVERERLHIRHLSLLFRLATHSYDRGDFSRSLEHALEMLRHDPCREDAHRLVMHCCVRMGLRAQALHQYRLCERVLHEEFGAAPEQATTALFDRIRLNAGGL
jgi:DNA-binding SARP family transcriptional activator